MDASANDVADKVMDPDKLYSNFLVAEKRLNTALKKCAKGACSKSVRARLYRDLGVVYIVGLRRLDKGKELLAKAIKADPNIELDQRIATPELEQLFSEAGGGLKSRTSDPPPSRSEEPAEDEPPAREREPEPEESESSSTESSEEPVGNMEGETESAAALSGLENEGTSEETSGDAESKPAERPLKKRTFLSLTLQQDFLYYPGDTGVCEEDIDVYDCFDYRGSEYEGPLFDEVGNEVTSGLRLATTRLLLGYDRQVGGNALIGVRLGYAFGGGPTPVSGAGFLPWHAEVRAAIYFGHRPFEARRIRPNLSAGFGLAEMSSHNAVEYWESRQDYEDEAEAGTLDAWRRSGKLFFAPGFGVMIPVKGKSGLTLDVRGMFMFGKAATGMALAAGYALGI
jgi:hypothetical protein